MAKCLLWVVLLKINYLIIMVPNFWATFSAEKSYALISTKNGLGYILADLFTKSSGHFLGCNLV
jgi:hypothetical protein